jgi:hypothetical protein
LPAALPVLVSVIGTEAVVPPTVPAANAVFAAVVQTTELQTRVTATDDAAPVMLEDCGVAAVQAGAVTAIVALEPLASVPVAGLTVKPLLEASEYAAGAAAVFCNVNVLLEVVPPTVPAGKVSVVTDGVGGGTAVQPRVTETGDAAPMMLEVCVPTVVQTGAVTVIGSDFAPTASVPVVGLSVKPLFEESVYVPEAVPVLRIVRVDVSLEVVPPTIPAGKAKVVTEAVKKGVMFRLSLIAAESQ